MSKSKKKNEQHSRIANQSRTHNHYEDDEVDLGNDSVDTVKASDQQPLSIQNTKKLLQAEKMSVSISMSNRTSISNVNISKIPPLHKIIDDRCLGSKRLSEQIKFNKEN